MSKLKTLALGIVLFTSTLASAQTCTFVIPQKAGGATDILARVLQKHNPNIQVEYKPGAYALPAINYIDKNTGAGIITTPIMYSKNSPEQNPQVSVIKVFGGYDHGIITSKNVSFKDLLTKKLTVGVSFLGSPAHVIGEQLKAKNKDLEIIPFGGDANAFVPLKSGDVDVYITAWPNINKWSTEHGFTVISKVSTSGNTLQEGVSMTNVSNFGVFASKNATKEQQENLLKCINTATTSAEAQKDLKNIHLTPLNKEGLEADKAIQTYINTLKEYGI